jgi:DNA (cytosine-5)-methyltransferase 1
MSYKAISLFSGMGGDSCGMKNAGIDVVAYSEYMPWARQTHDLNFPNCKMLGANVKSDITKIPDSEFLVYKDKIDIVFAGYPCQSFSSAGKRKVNDPRNTLFREFLRVAKLTNAKVIVGENVKGLMTKKAENGEKYIDIIEKEIEDLGYVSIKKVFKCHKYGVPQKRERLIHIGIKKEYLDEFNLSFPEEDHKEPSSWKGLEDIVSFSMKGAAKIGNETFDLSTLPNECVFTDLDNEEDENNPHKYLLLKRDLVNKSYKGKTYDTLFSFAKRGSPIHCEIIDVRKPSKTIICTYDHQPRLFVPVVNKNGQFLRMLLPDELKQIQSFPSDYKLAGNLKQQIVQCGNAVPPLVIEKIMKHIFKKKF